MPITVRDLRAFEGPNLYYGQPCVKLEVWADRDLRRELSDTLKSWAQAAAVVIGGIEQQIIAVPDGFVILTTFLTPFPSVGEQLCVGVVADLEAAERADPDEEYSHDEQLFAVIRERKREEPSLPLLQLHAEARAHGLRILPRPDGTLMIGTGRRGFVFDPAGLSLGLGVEVPWDTVGRIPLVAVTGTNGKTTTVRLITHIIAASGQIVGHTDTDGIYIGSEQVEQGDWAGFGGARRILTDPAVDVAVLETSRGGILRRGLAFDETDVSVMTNISADHLHELGVETVEDLARVKGVVALVAKPDGYVVLNADDPLVWEMREYVAASVIAFTRQPDARNVYEHRTAGGPVVWADAESMSIEFGDLRTQIALADAPITVNGVATHNVENALAAIGACLGLGLPLEQITNGLRTFGTDPSQNLGRLNIFRKANMQIVIDYAHNEAGLSALLAFGQRLRAQSGGQLIAILGGPGDRPDSQISGQGTLIGQGADRVFIHEEDRYRRGRSFGEVPNLYRTGALAAGLAPDRVSIFADELSAVQAALDLLEPGDVVITAAHAQRLEILDLLAQWAA